MEGTAPTSSSIRNAPHLDGLIPLPPLEVIRPAIMITAVKPDSPAALAGLSKDTAIYLFQDDGIQKPEDLENALLYAYQSHLFVGVFDPAKPLAGINYFWIDLVGM